MTFEKIFQRLMHYWVLYPLGICRIVNFMPFALGLECWCPEFDLAAGISFSVFHIGLPSFKCHQWSHITPWVRDGVGHYRWQEMLQVYDVERLLGKLWWQSWVPVLCSSLTDADHYINHFFLFFFHYFCSSDTTSLHWSRSCFCLFSVSTFDSQHVRC